jgi:hypothetical protein
MDLMNKFRKLPIFKIVPIESDLTEIAITDDPAIEEYFLKFSEDVVKIEFNSDKKIITGPVMVPDQLIYRNDSLGERFVTYDREGIHKAATLFMKNGLRFNREHTDIKLEIDIIESYFALEANSFGVPEGSWIVSAKVNDDDLWNELKSANKGFSFQSIFKNELVGTEQVNFNKQTMSLKEKLLDAINSVLFSEEVQTPVEKVEEFAEETPIEPEQPIEQPIEDEVKPLSEDMVKEMIDGAIASATEQIMIAVKGLVEQVKESEVAMSAMRTQLEEFSKQPLSQPITETVTNAPTESGFSYLSGVKF